RRWSTAMPAGSANAGGCCPTRPTGTGSRPCTSGTGAFRPRHAVPPSAMPWTPRRPERPRAAGCPPAGRRARCQPARGAAHATAKSIKPRFLLAAVLALPLLAGCRQDPEPAVQGPPTPEQTVKVLAGQLLAGDLAGYARTAVPPSLHAELETAWSE